MVKTKRLNVYDKISINSKMLHTKLPGKEGNKRVKEIDNNHIHYLIVSSINHNYRLFYNWKNTKNMDG